MFTDSLMRASTAVIKAVFDCRPQSCLFPTE